MRWFQDEWDDDYDALTYAEDEIISEEEKETDESAMYFDVPLPYRPIQLT